MSDPIFFLLSGNATEVKVFMLVSSIDSISEITMVMLSVITELCSIFLRYIWTFRRAVFLERDYVVDSLNKKIEENEWTAQWPGSDILNHIDC